MKKKKVFEPSCIKRLVGIVIEDPRQKSEEIYVKSLDLEGYRHCDKSGKTYRIRCVITYTKNSDNALRFETYDSAKRELTNHGLEPETFKFTPVFEQ